MNIKGLVYKVNFMVDMFFVDVSEDIDCFVFYDFFDDDV